MMPLPPSSLDRFVKICGYLGSDSAGERAAAAAKATELLRLHKMTWEEAVRPKVELAVLRDSFEYVDSDWRSIALAASRQPLLLSEWERNFVASLLQRRSLSLRQHEILEKIAVWLWHNGVRL